MRPPVSLGKAGERLGVSGGDIRRATGAERVSQARLAAWLAEPPTWLVRCRLRKAANNREKAAMVPVTCLVCGRSQLRRPGTAEAVRDLVLVCDACDRAGRKPAVVVPAGWQLGKHLQVAGGVRRLGAAGAAALWLARGARRGVPESLQGWGRH